MARLLDITPDRYNSHAVHHEDRVWAQTNCYLDLWIEVLHSLGLDPVPAMACAFSSRFDGAQWTFLKFKAEDIFALYGIDVAEMNVWRAPLIHIEDNLEAGMLSTVEVDGYWLPDTLGTSYHETHTKTTIVPNRIDRIAGELEYFHNSGYYVLRGDDFSGVFDLDRSSIPPFVPYVEQVRLSPVHEMNAGNIAEVARRNVAVRPREIRCESWDAGSSRIRNGSAQPAWRHSICGRSGCSDSAAPALNSPPMSANFSMLQGFPVHQRHQRGSAA